jgi:endo-1,4-beta-mannosidase
MGSDKKAAIVERFNRTQKTAMWKYLDAMGTTRWVDVLDDLVSNHNDTKHSSTLLKPKDVNSGNWREAWTNLFGRPSVDPSSTKFHIDDTVRISKYKSIFTKGYEVNFTSELFRVSRIIRGDPTVYKLTDLEGEDHIQGTFYKEALLLVSEPRDN